MSNSEKDMAKVRAADLKQVMSSDYGRRFVWRVLGYCQVYGPMRESNPHEMYRSIGRRDVGMFLMGNLAEHDPEGLAKMMAEGRVMAEIEFKKETKDGGRSDGNTNDGKQPSGYGDQGGESEYGKSDADL